ncbi:MAG: ubiquinol oxidase subunit II [Candidatus Saccharimonadales bacterium]
MKVRHWAVVAAIVSVVLLLGITLRLYVVDPIIMQPSGSIGIAQRDLFLFALGIMSLVAIPVFVLLGYITWKYRATNKKARYAPNWSSSPLLESLWWGIPILVVALLSLVSYQTSHRLDPFRPIQSSAKTIDVQVIALQWKWLFIYPEYNVASVNELIIPVSQPVAFAIAADSPMNSFWIPELGGQIYAMNGMSTKLHLEATRIGEFRGLSSNLSGEGFADMKFTVKSVSPETFAATMQQKTVNQPLDMSQYESLAVPGVMTEPQWFKLTDKELFQNVIDKYMLPSSEVTTYDRGMHATKRLAREGTR